MICSVILSFKKLNVKKILEPILYF